MKERYDNKNFSNESTEDLIKCKFVDICKLNTTQLIDQVKPWCSDLRSLEESSSYCIIRTKALKILGIDE